MAHSWEGNSEEVGESSFLTWKEKQQDIFYGKQFYMYETCNYFFTPFESTLSSSHST